MVKADPLVHISFLFQLICLCFQMLIVLFSKLNPGVGVDYFHVLFALLDSQNNFIRQLIIVQDTN